MLRKLAQPGGAGPSADSGRGRNADRRVSRLSLGCLALEDRCLPAFSVTAAAVFGPGSLRVVADLNAPIDTNTVEPTDLVIDGSLTAVSVTILDVDTLQFHLPALTAGSHTLTIAPGSIFDTSAVGITAFSTPLSIVAASQFTMKHNPRLQPGNAPLVGFAGSELDRVDVLWQTIPSGAGGTQDSFTVEYRAVGASIWQTTTLNAAIDTAVQSRFVRSASIVGLQWNADYEYRVRQRQGDVIVGEYQSEFHTRLQAGDPTNFTFAAYGDSASGTATGFKQVQTRINAIDPVFSVLLGDNVYNVGSHIESDARFDPIVNPPAAAWMAGHIDYLGLGNHDVGTASGLPSEQNYSVPIPVAGVTSSVAPPATERAEHNFSWDYGDVHFVTFDTNALGNSAASIARLDGLLKWVVADLNASTARWKIVYGHHPVSGTPDKSEVPSDNYYQQVVNRLKAAGADLFMTGHSHTYSWTYPLTGQINGTATYIDHGLDDHFHAGEGLPQLVSGMGGVERRPGDYNQFPFVAEGFTSTTALPSRLGFSKVDVTQDQLTVSYIAADDGSVIDSFVIAKDPNPQTVSFQQGVSGYAGTTDTQLVQNAPTTSYADAASLKVDSDDPGSTGLAVQALMRFDNLFGTGAGQIPLGATIRSATLQLQVSNESVNSMNLHRMLDAWSPTDTWNSKVSGIQINGVEAAAAADASSGRTQLGTTWFNVLPSLIAWQQNPSTNFGWAFIPTGADGVDFNSSEGAAPPKLIVTFVLPALPTISSLTPVIGPTTGGTIVVIGGTDFLGVTSIRFGGQNAVAFSVNSNTQITATAPPHAAATVDVVLFNSAGSSPTAGVADNFTYTPNVASVVVNGGPNVVLSGTGSPVSLAGQNSVVRQILVTFNQAVSVATDAFTVTPRSTNVTVRGGPAPSTAAVTASATAVTSSSYLVTFSGAGAPNGVISPGVYDLTTLGAKVSAGGDTMAGNRTDVFFALFGTIDANNSYTSATRGDGASRAFVDPGSLFAFSDAFGATSATPAGPPAYNLRFDSNLDGSIDPSDLFAFSDAFGVDWTF